jgi:hypothetical protein
MAFKVLGDASLALTVELTQDLDGGFLVVYLDADHWAKPKAPADAWSGE